MFRLGEFLRGLSWGLILVVAACGDDAPPPDGGSAGDGAMADMTPVCAEDGDCDDGLFCNGAERCAEGRCLLGEPVDCDDGIACTVDTCDEATDACGSLAPDLDGDGAGDASCLDGEGTPIGTDCDDGDPLRFAGNPEVCDTAGRDEDCDPSTFGRVDLDGDGAFDAACCNGDTCGTDCDDLRADVRPGATEVCDRRDNDCDGSFDEGVLASGFVDADRDGFGDGSMPVMACPGTTGFVAAAVGDDCDDADRGRNPGQVEVCDEVDNDCNGLVDDDPTVVPWYLDADGDGFGDPADAIDSCAPLPGRVLSGADCDDADPARNPGSAERCNGIDDDCNGEADFEIAPGDFEDDDGDGLVDVACGPPLGVDCADDDPVTGPGGVEACDGRDNDCDEAIDEDVIERTWVYDADGDGYGGRGDPRFPSVVACRPPAGYVGRTGDCDDGDAARFPGATERCDGADEDCDGRVDEGAMCACPAGRGDCNGDPSDGCETRLGTSMSHCGGCGQVCAAGPGVEEARCAGGDCVLLGCLDGFEDCDRNPANGCEVDVQNDTANCGDCGNICAGGATTTGVRCDFGQCRVDGCVAGRGDCNADGRDGCETLLNASPNCGGCGLSCGGGGCIDYGGGVFGCEFGCPDGMADCNSDPSDGCETRVVPATCGCGGGAVDCNALFGPLDSVVCVGRGPGAAVCERRGCVGGADDCGTGCIDTSEDPRHCGGCGIDCGSAPCAGGMCDCPAVGLDECDGRCVDTQSDFDHCGGCGTRCAGGEACRAGACVLDCGPGQQECAGACVDVRFDNDHCGSCGNVCPMSGPGFSSSSCNDFRCELFCDAGFGDCNGVPTDGCEADLDSPASCGSCGVSCGAGGSCMGGTCDRVTEVVQGSRHACALRELGGVACWGDPTDGRLGDGRTFGPPSTPVSVTGLPGSAFQLTVGDRHSCAIVDNVGTTEVWCWGDNQRSQLGCGARPECGTNSGLPLRTELPPTFLPLEIQAGREHTCAVGQEGGLDRVYCWGDNGLGQVGSGNVALQVSTPEAVTRAGVPISAFRIAVGGNFACALPAEPSAGIELSCWGDDSHGQLADGTAGGSSNEAQFSQSIPYSTFPPAIDAGARHACFGDGPDLRCWGEDPSGALGMAPGNNPTAVRVTGPSGGIDTFRLASDRTCVRRFDGTIRCRGDNLESELIPSSTANPVPAWTGVTQAGSALIGLGSATVASHYCGLRGDGAVFCWGDDQFGQLGRGTTGASGGVGRVNGL